MSVREDESGTTWLLVWGELDLTTISTLQAQLEELGNGGTPLTLDLSGLEFIDSEGIRLVLKAHKRAEQDGREFSVVLGPSRRVFDLVGITEMLHISTAAPPEVLDPTGTWRA